MKVDHGKRQAVIIEFEDGSRVIFHGPAQVDVDVRPKISVVKFTRPRELNVEERRESEYPRSAKTRADKDLWDTFFKGARQ